tara:strand:- start:1211 stop:1765 length:555 start_codon:yes stop_codon:yes gene_type:complete
MSKCYYLEYDIKDSSAPIIVTSINTANKDLIKEHSYFKKFFPEHSASVKAMISRVMPDGASEELVTNNAELGDVIWAQSAENSDKYIGYCITHDEDGDYSESAFKACMKSVSAKAHELGVQFVGMTKTGCNDNDEWFSKVDIIEEALGDVRPVVCIQTNEELLTILNRLDNLSTIKAVQPDQGS